MAERQEAERGTRTAHVVYRIGSRPLDFMIFIDGESPDSPRESFARATAAGIRARHRHASEPRRQLSAVYQAAREQLVADGFTVGPPQALQ